MNGVKTMVSMNPACPHLQTLLNSSRERPPPDLLSDHTITANQSSNDSSTSSSNNVYRGHVAAGIGRSGGESKPGSEHSSAAGSYRMAMENIIDEYSRCKFI